MSKRMSDVLSPVVTPFQSAGSPDPVRFERQCRTLVAFANSAGGRLVLGVEDATHHVVGVDNPLDAEERLASLIADSILPRLLPEVEIMP